MLVLTGVGIGAGAAATETTRLRKPRRHVDVAVFMIPNFQQVWRLSTVLSAVCCLLSALCSLMIGIRREEGACLHPETRDSIPAPMDLINIGSQVVVDSSGPLFILQPSPHRHHLYHPALSHSEASFLLRYVAPESSSLTEACGWNFPPRGLLKRTQFPR